MSSGVCRLLWELQSYTGRVPVVGDAVSTSTGKGDIKAVLYEYMSPQGQEAGFSDSSKLLRSEIM